MEVKVFYPDYWEDEDKYDKPLAAINEIANPVLIVTDEVVDEIDDEHDSPLIVIRKGGKTLVIADWDDVEVFEDDDEVGEYEDVPDFEILQEFLGFDVDENADWRERDWYVRKEVGYCTSVDDVKRLAVGEACRFKGPDGDYRVVRFGDDMYLVEGFFEVYDEKIQPPNWVEVSRFVKFDGVREIVENDNFYDFDGENEWRVDKFANYVSQVIDYLAVGPGEEYDYIVYVCNGDIFEVEWLVKDRKLTERDKRWIFGLLKKYWPGEIHYVLFTYVAETVGELLDLFDMASSC